jgi:hypothetical protein
MGTYTFTRPLSGALAATQAGNLLKAHTPGEVESVNLIYIPISHEEH